MSVSDYNSCNIFNFEVIDNIKNEVIVEINNDLNDIINKAQLDSNLCTADEELVYSFKIMNSNDRVSVISSSKYNYLVCRIGTKDNVEFEFPQNKIDSWNQFTYSYYFRGGGKENLGLKLNHLLFETELSKFDIYYEFNAVKESVDAGIKIIDKKTNSETYIEADKDSFIGVLWFEGDKIKVNFPYPTVIN